MYDVPDYLNVRISVNKHFCFVGLLNWLIQCFSVKRLFIDREINCKTYCTNGYLNLSFYANFAMTQLNSFCVLLAMTIWSIYQYCIMARYLKKYILHTFIFKNPSYSFVAFNPYCGSLCVIVSHWLHTHSQKYLQCFY